MKPSRRKFLTVTGSAAIASVAGVGSASAATSPAEIPIPDNTDMTYPTMGTSADNPTATVYGNFKCPFTQGFVKDNLHEIIEEYVVPGKLNIRFRQLAYEPNKGVQTHSAPGTFISSSDPRIGAGSLAVWDVSPDDYWSYFFTMFSELVSGTVTADDLAGRMEKAGVDNIDEIVEQIESERYSDLVRDSTHDARDLDVNYTPQWEMAGKLANPHHEVEDILNFIESNISDAVPHLPKEDTEETESEDPSESESSESESSESESDESESDQSSKATATITFDGNSAQGWAHYEVTVSGEFKENSTSSAAIEDGDAISGSTAKGGVGQWKDSYTYTGKITDINLTQAIDVYRDGELVDLEELNADIKQNKLDAKLKSAEDDTKFEFGSKAKEAGSASVQCTR